MNYSHKDNILFVDEKHFDFYKEKEAALKPDRYLKALIYTVGMCHDTRRNFDRIYDRKERSIITEVIREGWQTGTSSKVTRLAFQLFTDTTPTAFSYDKDDNETESITECKRYSVSDIFCCELAPYFVEAIKLRYPEYFTER